MRFSLLSPFGLPKETLTAPESDPLSMIEASENGVSILEMIPDAEVSATIESPKGPSIVSGLRSKALFLAHYVAVSSAVFFLLLGAANYSAYSNIVWSRLSPESAEAASRSVNDALGKSKITVYAEESASGADADETTAEELKKQLEEANVSVKENLLSPKRLVPAKPQITVDFDIVPYENRIVIPKIGKNIPMVDVEAGNGFDLDHLENIFMNELEKGVVRYPGTARPGEIGNAFVFGHSSNYPWVRGQYNQVFALLDELQFGDEIIVYYNQKKYVYVIREKKVVKPGDVKILNRKEDKSEFSLMTCWPVGTTLKRLIVFAELQTPEASQ